MARRWPWSPGSGAAPGRGDRALAARPRVPGADLDPDLPDDRRHARDGADHRGSRSRRSPRWVRDSTDRLDVLVNNAGVHLDLRSAWHEPHLVDGMEVHWRTNYLGHRPADPAADPAAARHRAGRTARRGWSTSSRSCTPAAATTGWTATSRRTTPGRRTAPPSWPWCTRRTRSSGGTATAGCTATRCTRARWPPTSPTAASRPRRCWRGCGSWRLRSSGAPCQAPADAARTVVFCATSPQAEPGGYHRSSAPSAPSEDAQDEEAGRILWENTSRWCDPT